MQVILFEQIKACVQVCDECECFYLRMGVARVFVHLWVQAASHLHGDLHLCTHECVCMPMLHAHMHVLVSVSSC